MAKSGEKCYNIGRNDEKSRKAKGENGMEEQKKVEKRATAEDLAKKVAQLMREELIGITSVDKEKIIFSLAGGQTFCLTVTEI